VAGHNPKREHQRGANSAAPGKREQTLQWCHYLSSPSARRPAMSPSVFGHEAISELLNVDREEKLYENAITFQLFDKYQSSPV